MNETDKEMDIIETPGQTDAQEPDTQETAAQESAAVAHRYESPVARTMRRVYGGGVILSLLYLLSQLALTFSSYFAQKAQYQVYIEMGQDISQQITALSMSLYYALAGVIMPFTIMIGASFLFLFFSELLEQNARKSH